MIGIIGFESLRVMQYLDKYTKILDRQKIEYEVVYWNRNGITNTDSRYIPYQKTINTYVPFQEKIHRFLGYVNFIYNIIGSHKYDRLIVLTTQTAVALSPLLLTKYRKKFLFDYRDITFERNLFYRFLVKTLFRQSNGVLISSLGFVETLGNSENYMFSHNCRNFDTVNIPKTTSEKTRIVYWGMVRQAEFNKRICDLFGNDDRFTLIYHGEGYYEEIEKYCSEKNYINITFTGGYERSEMEQFVANTDILLNAYENDRQQQPALTVKLYDGMRYTLPQIVMADSYMAEFLNNDTIAYRLALEHPDSVSEIEEWYLSLSQEKLASEYQQLRETLIADEDAFTCLVKEFSTPTPINLTSLKSKGGES